MGYKNLSWKRKKIVEKKSEWTLHNYNRVMPRIFFVSGSLSKWKWSQMRKTSTTNFSALFTWKTKILQFSSIFFYIHYNTFLNTSLFSFQGILISLIFLHIKKYKERYFCKINMSKCLIVIRKYECNIQIKYNHDNFIIKVWQKQLQATKYIELIWIHKFVEPQPQFNMKPDNITYKVLRIFYIRNLVFSMIHCCGSTQF